LLDGEQTLNDEQRPMTGKSLEGEQQLEAEQTARWRANAGVH
jgi:hypothetical protein